MKRGKNRRQSKNVIKKVQRKYVVVRNRSYGAPLIGTKIYFEGKRPKLLNKKDGSIKFGKNILELLQKNFQRFRWIITPRENGIKLERGIYRVRTSIQLLNRMNQENFDRSRDIKNDIIKNQFSNIYPDYFKKEHIPVYVPGNLEKVLKSTITSRLSSEDKQAFLDFLPDFITSESLSSVNLIKAETEIKTLWELAKELKEAIKDTHSESWWQTFIHKNILIIQQGYIKAIEKINISIGNVKFPDFSLVTHDNYLDILEIKRPSTDLVKFDDSRSNYYWSAEMAKAISQVENYIANVSAHKDPIRNYLRDEHKVELQVLKPRGIILAGSVTALIEQKQKDDFRLLAHSLKNIDILTYDELLTRLVNYIAVLESFKRPNSSSKKK